MPDEVGYRSVLLLADVAGVAESEVDVRALRAHPVTVSLLGWPLCDLLWLFLIDILLIIDFLGFSRVFALMHVLGLSVVVLFRLGLLAPEALLPSLEVVVQALAALPSSLREVESVNFLLNLLLLRFLLRLLLNFIIFWYILMVLNPRGRGLGLGLRNLSCNLLKLVHLLLGDVLLSHLVHVLLVVNYLVKIGHILNWKLTIIVRIAHGLGLSHKLGSIDIVHRARED